MAYDFELIIVEYPTSKKSLYGQFIYRGFLLCAVFIYGRVHLHTPGVRCGGRSTFREPVVRDNLIEALGAVVPFPGEALGALYVLHFLLLTSRSWATEAADRFLFLEVDVPGVFGGRPDGPAGLSAKRRVLLGSTFSAMAWQPLQLQSGD